MIYTTRGRDTLQAAIPMEFENYPSIYCYTSTYGCFGRSKKIGWYAFIKNDAIK